MDSQTIVAITSVVFATFVGLVVPLMAFRFALRQEHIRLIREHRAALYADMLVEAHAEQQWLRWWIAGTDAAGERPPFEDLRLSSLERARLGARGTALGSSTVNGHFNELIGIMGRIHFQCALGQVHTDVAQMELNMQAGAAHDALEAAIRQELNADTPILPQRGRRLVRDRS
ncbi:hypothetical protein ACIQMY_20810 [Streptomyces sp. NPDC091368]|uniref:hypothetical protein n=1 Tax=Streptomyces sp. NPDC091368 TaxID=3365993 RepID=UPI0038088FA7